MQFLEILSAIFILAGVMFIFLAAVGLLRFPDFYTRNSASTKALMLGLGLILIGTGLYYNQILIFVELLAISLFIFLITPLSSHIIARAAFKTKVPFWNKTNLEEIKKAKPKKGDKND